MTGPGFVDLAALDTLEVVEFLESLTIGVHFTAKAWPMVGVIREAHACVLEPWQAREVGNLLQTVAERLIRAADGMESARAIVMQRPEFGGADFGGES